MASELEGDGVGEAGAAEEGGVDAGRVGAFFDVDRTLLAVNSGRSWIGYAWRRGDLSATIVPRALWWLVKYALAGDRFDFEETAARAASLYAGREQAALKADVREWFSNSLATFVCAQGRERVAYHRARGHVIALLTSGSRFLAQPLAELLGVEHILCTELEVDALGLLTGRHVAPACGGPGKIVYAERFAAEHGLELSRSFFYTDSASDIPMLERVGRPRVINPDRVLLRYARERGWGYERWTT